MGFLILHVLFATLVYLFTDCPQLARQLIIIIIIIIIILLLIIIIIMRMRMRIITFIMRKFHKMFKCAVLDTFGT